MGGYMTNHGDLELSRAQIILEGLAKREDEIFRRRREGLSCYIFYLIGHIIYPCCHCDLLRY
ncbi:hypothetical protein BDN70DRAFT_887676 [Pholiota conissans]|uniref:Uncharacterized protein n=1 Tax=Pholiota conissans TaxID=109636 RepID=A0A9P6CS73_9AGAR|nr:hypothetical protein BDN70DRAFT_887676 [Pholiota conissans]